MPKEQIVDAPNLGPNDIIIKALVCGIQSRSNLILIFILTFLNRNGAFYLIDLPNVPVTIKDASSFLLNPKTPLKGSIIGVTEEYPFTLEGLEKTIDRCDKSLDRYRAVLMAKD
ncbi:uncharacterized protein BX663DRAFT_556531 [Cokeromyces recurvatus]|uniref:uncharacterized protein n=1 Tax=Cokeromyces recurvatus TaxID=90255 RepID=UPI0022201D4F|nr:uncharacterized protein BX663DRAFT_556531 [Cokeromyces recurvatus]KAI7897682.1 hypothetical protein BX663DRAFT_556531 [Cokeromyces recurvatus]